jgi:hypothetical protein
MDEIRQIDPFARPERFSEHRSVPVDHYFGNAPGEPLADAFIQPAWQPFAVDMFM